MKIRFDYHIEPRDFTIVDVEEFDEIETIEELRDALLDCYPEPSWGADVFEDDVEKMWKEIQRRKSNA